MTVLCGNLGRVLFVFIRTYPWHVSFEGEHVRGMMTLDLLDLLVTIRVFGFGSAATATFVVANILNCRLPLASRTLMIHGCS